MAGLVETHHAQSALKKELNEMAIEPDMIIITMTDHRGTGRIRMGKTLHHDAMLTARYPAHGMDQTRNPIGKVEIIKSVVAGQERIENTTLI